MMTPMLQVRWTDANFDRDENPGLAPVTSVGWLVDEDAEKMVLAAERFDDGTYRDFTVIPHGCIVWTAALDVPTMKSKPQRMGFGAIDLSGS